ncbi:unnamed protein product [Periconia digitata]|uniref:20S-pre-rRNA D-site endonuclease NOB1 n=1 Tax=Periconia digitata TaxID=1303443 RepID=A0A9W4U4Y4_9PLEO|nr:unnamed protein product [Periconia digitata]
MASEPNSKPINSIIIDTGPLINNTVSISTIIGSAEHLYTTPAIISEIRDAATRSRVETTLLPFLNIKTPTPASYEAVSAFARRTGDFSVLSKQDLGILALAYEIHCEKYGGTWGLRDEPGKELNKKPGDEDEEDDGGWEKAGGRRRGGRNKKPARKPKQKVFEVTEFEDDDPKPPRPLEGEDTTTSDEVSSSTVKPNPTEDLLNLESTPASNIVEKELTPKDTKIEEQPVESEIVLPTSGNSQTETTADIADSSTVVPATQDGPSSNERSEQEKSKEEPSTKSTEDAPSLEKTEQDMSTLHNSPPVDSAAPSIDSDDSDGDWITPSNLHQHQAKDSGNAPISAATKQMRVATMTTDYAMQNVLLQMNLRLLSPAMQRVRQIRSTIMRCHACFLTTREMDKQFCPRCGGPTLQRVTCSTDAKGVFRIHLAKNYQWNKRGNVFSVPKPIAGTANGKLRGTGGGQGGWGRDLVLAEDQKEYTRQIDEGKRSKARDLMDEDYLPGILTGDRGKAGGRPKVGAGRNVNSRKRF